MNARLNIFLVALLLFLSACDKKETTPVVKDEASEINFGTAVTKADSEVSFDKFGVSLTLMQPDSETPKYISWLDNEEVRKVTSNGQTSWTYDNTRYWLDNCYYYFVASAPYSQDGGFVKNQHTEEGVDYNVYTLNVQTPETADLDLLTATTFVDTKNARHPEVVPLTFQHLMTKVNLKISQDTNSDPDNDYYITKITLSNVKSQATYTVIPVNDRLEQSLIVSNSTTSSFTKSFTSPTALKAGQISVWGDLNDENGKGGLLLIPQRIAENSMRLRIDYRYLMAGSDQYKELYVDVYLPASNDLWASGKVITYILSFAKQNEIKFSAPTVEPWGSPQTGGTIIIK